MGGPGKLARFIAWNSALQAQQLKEFWEMSRSALDQVADQVGEVDDSDTDEAEGSLMASVVSDLDASQQVTGIPTDRSGTEFFPPMAIQDESGVKAWNLDASYLQRIGGPEWTVGQSYTHCAWIQWRPSDLGWRTLFRGSKDHSIIVKSDGKELGMYSDRKGAFRGSGYRIVLGSFQLVCVVGKAQSQQSAIGVSKFFVGSVSESPKFVCQADRVVSGTKVYRMGWPGQGPGKLARFTAWNSALQAQQLKEFWKLSQPSLVVS